MENTLKDLGFNPIRRIIKYKTIEGEEKEISIFNPTKEEARKLLSDLIKNSDFTENDMNINFNYFLFHFVKELTDIEFSENEEESLKVLQNPDIPLQKVIMELTELLMDLMEIHVKENQIVDKSQLQSDELKEIISKCKNITEILSKVKQ